MIFEQIIVPQNAGANKSPAKCGANNNILFDEYLGARCVARQYIFDRKLRTCDIDFRAVLCRCFDIFEFRFGSVGAFARRSNARALACGDIIYQLVRVFANDLSDNSIGVAWVGVNAECRGINQQSLAFDEARYLRSRLVVVHTMHRRLSLFFELSKF